MATDLTPTASTLTARWFVLAALAALFGATLAPAPWPEGPAVLVVDVQGAHVEAPVRVGGEAVAVDTPAGPVTLSAVTVDRPVQATAPEGARVALRLADGREALLPVVGTAPEGRALKRNPPVHAAVVLGLLAAVVVLWVSEALPLWVTGLLVPVVLVAAADTPLAAALAPFFSGTIALFLGGFLLAEALAKEGLDRRLALWAVDRLGRSPASLFATLMAVAAFLSLWMSNTAAAAVLIPLAIAVAAPITGKGYDKVLILGVAYAANTGGIGSAIGTPGNQVAVRFLDEQLGHPISFVGWFAVGLPVVAVVLPAIGAVLWWRLAPEVTPAAFARAREIAREERAAAGPLTAGAWRVAGVFALMVAAWLTEELHGVDAAVVALAGVVALAAVGAIDTPDLHRIGWPALLTFGGGLSLGGALARSGVSDFVATQLEALATVPAPLAVLAVATLTAGLTAVASNTASAAVLVPLAAPLAGILGADPVVLALVVAVASSLDYALVIGTPPTMMAYGTGRFTVAEIFRAGLLLDVIALGLLLAVAVAVWPWLGIGL
jgi:sodium-dependent dicarboxylate transporter 2/3/5